MPKKVVTAKFIKKTTPYTYDWGVQDTKLGLFNAPPDITDADIDGIVQAIGATLDGEMPPCRDTPGMVRKLRFIRRSGNTITVPVANRSILISAATVIRGILNKTDNEVVCIELIGEEYANLNDEMGIKYTAGSFAETHRAPAEAPKQYYYSGQIEYKADSTNPIGGVIFQPIKAISDNADSEASQVANVWSNCVGDFVTAIPCPRGQGRGNPMKHRRFILTFLTGTSVEGEEGEEPLSEIDNSEQLEVPVKEYQAAQILTCGQNLAKLQGAYCIGYRGESYKRFHKLLPQL